ncbi:MAG: hypothetical protein ACREAU_01130 [Nitrosopumilaceae archaeon]
MNNLYDTRLSINEVKDIINQYAHNPHINIIGNDLRMLILFFYQQHPEGTLEKWNKFEEIFGRHITTEERITSMNWFPYTPYVYISKDLNIQDFLGLSSLITEIETLIQQSSKLLRWKDVNDMNNTLREIEEYYFKLGLKRLYEIINRNIDFDLELKITLCTEEEELITHTEPLFRISLEDALLKQEKNNDDVGFANLNCEHENTTGQKTENPFCWLAHQLTDHYSIKVETLLTTTHIYSQLVIVEETKEWKLKNVT